MASSQRVWRAAFRRPVNAMCAKFQPFDNRYHAGRVIAEKLNAYRDHPEALVLALPRGGVPVAVEVADALRVPLDILIVRKLGVPGQPELAFGAVAMGGVRVLNQDLLRRLNISDEEVEAITASELQEMERREHIYRDERPQPQVENRIVILIDDGLATGATMMAAVRALRTLHPARIVVAVPAASPETCRQLQREVDEVICAITPARFYSVGSWYRDFAQVTDMDVQKLLSEVQSR